MGVGCSQCKKERFRVTKLMSEEEFLEKLREISNEIFLADQYIDMRTPIYFWCDKHKVRWKTYPYNILKGCGCPECGKEKIGNKNSKSNQEYVEELQKKNPNIITLEPYKGASTPILHKCLIDGYEWKARPGNILFGTGCPKCSKHVKRTHKEYVEEALKINPDIEVIGEYVGTSVPILHRCRIDEYIWKVAPSSILSGYGCPRCNESKGERITRQWLEKNKINFVYQKKFIDCRDLAPLPFDFYLPDFNLCIEYDGEQHFWPVFDENSFYKTILHDGMKNNYCLWNGIELLRIPYFKDVNKELEKYFRKNFLLN